MKYIKTFETLYSDYKNLYLINDINNNKYESIITRDLLEIIGVDVDYYDKNPNEDWICEYNINVIEFLKEIFLNKNITFFSKNKNDENRYIKETVEDVNLFAYKEELYIFVKINSSWKIIDNNKITIIYDYDALDKPEHKLLKILKKAKKYNI
jgi:hypothetical protein